MRPVGVRAARDDHVDAEGDRVAPREQLARGLRRGVRRPRCERIGLDALAALDRSVDLVGRDLEQARRARALAAHRPLVLAAHGLEERVDAVHVGAEERGRIEDRAVDVRLRGEVHDRVGLTRERGDQTLIGDVPSHELETRRARRVVRDVAQVRLATRVRELVEHGHAHAPVAGERATRETRADETGTAGDDDVGRSHQTGSGACLSAPIPRASWPFAWPFPFAACVAFGALLMVIV